MADTTLLNWLVFNSISETWSTFATNGIILSFFGGAGLASVFVVMIIGLSNVDKNEKEIKSSRSRLDPEERVLEDK
jgi:hypothetical protein